LNPLKFAFLPRKEQLRHLLFEQNAAGERVYIPYGAANAWVRRAYLVPSDEVAERIERLHSRWSRAFTLLAVILVLWVTWLIARRTEAVFEVIGPHFGWAVVGAVFLGMLYPYLPGWFTLRGVGSLSRATPRSLHDVVRHHDRLIGSTLLAWLFAAVSLAGAAFIGIVIVKLFIAGHTGAGLMMAAIAITAIPAVIIAPAVVKLRRLRAENARLEAAVRERTAELAELNRTLESRIAEQVRDIERLGQLRHFFAAPVAEMILGGTGDFDPARVHRRELSVISVDLRGFTAFSETAEPEEVIGVLRIYHAELGILVNRHQATLEHFAGDGAIIFLNDPVEAPDHPERAVRLAVELRAAMRPHLDEWRRLGFDLGLGTGVAVGYATIGAIGYEGRWEYAAIGSVCNLATRLCGHAKDGQVVTTHRVRARIASQTRFIPLGELTLRGFTRPVAAFDVDPAGA
jgi:adenylate cyclase